MECAVELKKWVLRLAIGIVFDFIISQMIN